MRPLYTTEPTPRSRKMTDGPPLNPPEVLKALRTKLRVPQPKAAKHPLIRALRAEVGIQIYYHESRRSEIVLRTGTSPTESVYDDGALYVHTRATKEPNVLVHELCHAIVARKLGMLDQTNFGLQYNISKSDQEEIDTCLIEFYLAFMSGYYSWKMLSHYIHEYNFEDRLVDTLDYDDYHSVERTGLDAYTKDSLVEFLMKCRDVALDYPGVREVCNRLFVSISEMALRTRINNHWRIQ